MSSPDTEVLIVGAGPTGLFLASELLRRGVRCIIIDMLPGPSEKSRALAIHARTLEVFEQVGLIDEFLSVGWKSTAFTVFDRRKQIVRMTFKGLDSPFPFLLSLPQWHTERILADSVRAAGGKIHWNATLERLEQSADGVRAVIRRSQTNDKVAEISCKWVVGCDGAHSTVRSLLDIDFPGFPYWEQYVLADVKFSTTLNPEDHYIFSGRSGVAGFHPFSADSARIFADLGRIRRPRRQTNRLPIDREKFREPTHEELQAILDERGPGAVELRQINWLSMHTIHRRVVSSYRHGRVLLAGDAAHIHSPTGGQGMNLGLQDAYNLAWKLTLVQKQLAGESLLDSYGVERRMICRKVSAMSDFFSRINTVRSPISQGVRNCIGPILAKREDVRKVYREAVTQISLNYRYSPIVAESIETVSRNSVLRNSVEAACAGTAVGKQECDRIGRSKPMQAGDRASDVLVFDTDRSVRIFELIRSMKHTLLMFGGEEIHADTEGAFIEVGQLVETRYAHLIDTYVVLKEKKDFPDGQFGSNRYMDPDLSAHRKYGVRFASLVLVRPDGYIAFRSSPPRRADIANYLISNLCLSV